MPPGSVLRLIAAALFGALVLKIVVLTVPSYALLWSAVFLRVLGRAASLYGVEGT